MRDDMIWVEEADGGVHYEIPEELDGKKERGLYGYEGKETTSPVKAIRAKCLDCCCGHSNEVKWCQAFKCPLFPFRFGKNPYYGRNPK